MSFTITELQQRYAAHPQIEAALRLLADDQLKHLFVGGLHGSSASLLASVLVGRAGRPFVFVLGDGEEAGYFYHDLVQVLGDGQVLFFPSSFRRAIKYGQKDAANEILRTEVLSRLQKETRGEDPHPPRGRAGGHDVRHRGAPQLRLRAYRLCL